MAVVAPCGGQVVAPGERVRCRHHAARRARPSVCHSTWRTPEALPVGGSVLTYLGVDRSSADGWGLAIPPVDLCGDSRCRIVAIATELGGAVLEARSGWFTLEDPDSPWVWRVDPEPSSVAGTVLWSTYQPATERGLANSFLALAVDGSSGEASGLCPEEAQVADGAALPIEAGRHRVTVLSRCFRWIRRPHRRTASTSRS